MGKPARRMMRERERMGLVTGIVVHEDIPHDDGEWMEFRPLSGKQLRKAQQVRQSRSREVLRELGGDIYKSIRESNVDKEEIEAAQRDPLNDYDTDMLLESSIIAWSYPEKVKGNLEYLDKVTETWALGVIAKISGLIEEDEDAKATAS